MPRLVAFLRAINVGGHTVTMDRLRREFEALGLAEVETFLASGNVLFSGGAIRARALEGRIGARLREALGYEVVTFVRSDAEVAAVAGHPAFRAADVEAARAYNVAFLAEPVDAAGRRKLGTLRTEIDDFHVHGREIYWLCQRGQSQSTFSNAVLERTLGVRATLRGMNTIRKLAAKYPPSGR